MQPSPTNSPGMPLGQSKTQPRMISFQYEGRDAATFIVEEEQVDTVVLPEYDKNLDLPFTCFIDAKHHVHFEYGNGAFCPTEEKRRYIKWFFDPMSYYRRIAASIIEGSLIKDERTLIGGATFHYYRSKDEAYGQYWGMLFPDQAKERGIDPQVLKGAAKHQLDMIVRFLHHLRVKVCYTTSAVPAAIKQIEAHGWVRYQPKGLKDRFDLFRGTFPVSLRQRELAFKKIFNYKGSQE